MAWPAAQNPAGTGARCTHLRAPAGYAREMLVLSRRVGERLMIGDDIVVTVIEVRSDGVRLGIDAPRHIAINRAEVHEAVQQANREASESASAADDAAIEALRRLAPPTRDPR